MDSQKNYVSVNSLTSDQKKQLKDAIVEISDSMLRVSGEKDIQKEAINDISEKLGIEKKVIRQMAKTYFKSNFNEVTEENKMFEEFYEVVINSKV